MLLANVVSETEGYLVDVMRHLLQKYPLWLGSTQFRLADIVGKQPDELILMAAEERLSKLMYKRPAEYLAELAETLSIDAAPLQGLWPRFVEVKARRDLGTHNSWTINDTYRRKVAEAGLPVGDGVGPKMYPDFAYLRLALGNSDAIVRNIAVQLDKRFGGDQLIWPESSSTVAQGKV